MHYVLGVPGIWGPIPWSKAGPDQLLKSHNKGDPYGGPIFSHIFSNGAFICGTCRGRGNSNSQSFDWHMMYVNGWQDGP
jgi:hypothetical protein